MNNPFDTPAFGLTQLTNAINLVPNMYGKIGGLGIFADKPVSTRNIAVEERNGILNLLQSKPIGSPGTVETNVKRKLRSFIIPHIPHDGAVEAEEVQGVRAFGSESTPQSVVGVMTDKLTSMRNKHAITLEYLRMGAVKGLILDADGSTLYDLYSEFGVTQKTIAMALATATTEVVNKCQDISGYLEDNLLGETMNGAVALCSPEFFAKLVVQPNVKEAYKFAMSNEFLRQDLRVPGFDFGGIKWVEYRGVATDAAGNSRRFIAANEAHVVPLGTMDTFKTYYAPADFNETVNTLGQPIYAKQEPRKWNRGTDIHTQSNPLPMCHRPALLVKLTTN